MSKRSFVPDQSAVAAYVANPGSIAWEQSCYLGKPYLGGYEHSLRDARGRYEYIADTAKVLGYSLIDRAHQMAAVVQILEDLAPYDGTVECDLPSTIWSEVVPGSPLIFGTF